MLPPGPTVAYLCIYQSDPNELFQTYATSNAAGLVDYVNERPETGEQACLMGDDVTHTARFLVVVGYAEGYAVVRPDCGFVESMGAVRYESGLGIFNFFGVSPRDAWP